MPSAWRGTRTSNGVTVCKQPSKTRCLRVGKRHHSSSGGESRNVSLPTLSLQTLMDQVALPRWRRQDILTPSSGASRTFSEIMLVHLRSAKLTHVVFVYIVPLPIKTGELGVGVPTWQIREAQKQQMFFLFSQRPKKRASFHLSQIRSLQISKSFSTPSCVVSIHLSRSSVFPMDNSCQLVTGTAPDPRLVLLTQSQSFPE